MVKLNDLTSALDNLIGSIAHDETDGLIMAAGIAEQHLFKFFLAEGMSAPDARVLAQRLIKEMMS